MSANHVIIGVHITDRTTRAREVQNIFTEFGCNIKTRLGIHDTSEAFCSPNGLLLLDFVGTDDDAKLMVEKLSVIEGVDVKTMVFTH